MRNRGSASADPPETNYETSQRDGRRLGVFGASRGAAFWLVIARQRLAEVADPAAQAFPDAREPAHSEQDQHDRQDDHAPDPVKPEQHCSGVSMRETTLRRATSADEVR